jgi:hypothetical protein
MPSTGTLITIASVTMIAIYSALATLTSGSLTSVAWPLLVAAIALPLVHDAIVETDQNPS